MFLKGALLIFLLELLGVTAENTEWRSCVGKCYHLGDQMTSFDKNRIYCHNLPDAIPVEFGDVLADSVAQRLTPCKLNFQEEKPYWMDKTSMNTLCRTVSFKDTLAKYNQQADCSGMAYPFCEKKITNCQATFHSGLNYSWIKENNMWYKVSETAQIYSESLKYCQDQIASLAIPGSYHSVTSLGMALGISSNSSSISFWVNSTGGTCNTGATDPACVLTYTNLIVHSVSAKGIHETYLALCQATSPYVPTTTTQIASTSQTTSTIPTTPQPTTVSTTTISTTIPTTAMQKTTTSTRQTTATTTTTTTTTPPTTITTTTARQTIATTTTPPQTTTRQITEASTTTTPPTTTTTKQTTTSLSTTTLPTMKSTEAQTTLTTISITTTAATTKSFAPPKTTATKEQWIQIGKDEYYVNYNRSTYTEAERFCREENASLISFFNPTKYFNILSQITDNMESYWVGARRQSNSGQGCLSFLNSNSTLTVNPCDTERMSVCSRLVNGSIEHILDDPAFKQLIRKMTVDKNETSQAWRKLNSADDKRPSATATGSVGVFIVGLIAALVVASDCVGIKTVAKKKITH